MSHEDSGDGFVAPKPLRSCLKNSMSGNLLTITESSEKTIETNDGGSCACMTGVSSFQYYWIYNEFNRISSCSTRYSFLLWHSQSDHPRTYVLDRPIMPSSRLLSCLAPVFLGSSPSDITRLSHDRSEVLESIILSQFGSDSNQLLGELQFSYICFLLGQVFIRFIFVFSLLLYFFTHSLKRSHSFSFQNYEAFDHWKSLVIVIYINITPAPDVFYREEL